MRHLHFELIGGASGDMILAALSRLAGENRSASVIDGLKTLLPHEKFEVKIEDVGKGGFAGVRAKVEIQESHHHRTLRDIEGILLSPVLSDGAREKALRVFRRLAEAEARVHGVTPDKIHFHEVGAVDSIVDIAGSCMLLEELGAASISFSPFPCGRGTIQCAHGTLPNPAPATMELMKGFPVFQTDEPFELVTPTGAALLTALGEASSGFAGTLSDAAVSFGSRELNARPNMLRVSMTDAAAAGRGRDFVRLLETNVDDCNPEIIGGLCSRLMTAGALDVFTTPVQMKKQRPGVVLSVICPENKKDALERMIFEEAATFGIRESLVERRILERESREVSTPFGAVSVKTGFLEGRAVAFSPEYEDCARVAEKAGRPVREICSSAFHEAAKKIKDTK